MAHEIITASIKCFCINSRLKIDKYINGLHKSLDFKGWNVLFFLSYYSILIRKDQENEMNILFFILFCTFKVI